jgi:hypothetical protein
MSSRYVEPMTLTTANTKSHADVRQVSNCLIKPSLPLGLSVRFSESGGNSVRSERASRSSAGLRVWLVYCCGVELTGSRGQVSETLCCVPEANRNLDGRV